MFLREKMDRRRSREIEGSAAAVVVVAVTTGAAGVPVVGRMEAGPVLVEELAAAAGVIKMVVRGFGI